jgi:2-oxoglutarate dehydrogenase E2 component (dihydrolipoamide succinyltransferase)
MADITMPQLGETVTEGTITRWLKQIGDAVAEDEMLFEVSTDKVDSEVPSPTGGYLSEILVPEGETVDVGTRLAVISATQSGDGSAPAPAAGTVGETGGTDGGDAAPPEPVADQVAAQLPAIDQEEAAEAEPPPLPAAAAASDPGAAPARSQARVGTAVPAVAATTAPAGADPASADPVDGGGHALLSPVVRRLISEHGLDPAKIRGSGVGGRITRSDVLKLTDIGDRASAPAPARPASPAPPTAGRPVVPRAGAGDRDEVIPFSRIRRVTAEHMVRSQATSAHTLVSVEVDYAGVDRVRASRQERFRAEEGVGLTYLPFVARAVVDAIAEFPHLNSSVGDDELIVHRYVDLGIAVDIGFEGLLVPVVRDAETKRLRAIAREIAALAGKARTKRLSPDDLVGGTFTITNAGPFGTFITYPVINQPQTAILSTDGVKKRPVVVTLPDGTDGIAIHPTGILALAFDHRAFDGAYAAAFVARVKQILETRDWESEV